MAQATLTILADVKQAVSSLNKLETQGKKSLDILSTSFKALSGAAVAFAGAFTVNKIVSTISDLASEASVAEESLNNMKTALALSGQFSSEAVAGLSDFSSELQKTTKFGDDVIQGQLALALNYGLTTEQAKELVEASTDLSAVTGKDLNEATQLLLKSYDGEIGKIDNLNPKIKELTKEQLANGEAVKILLSQYSGAAASQAQTFGGRLAQLVNAFGDLREEIGFNITQNPQVLAAITSLKGVFELLTTDVKNSSSALGKFISSSVIGLNSLLIAATKLTAIMIELTRISLEAGAVLKFVFRDGLGAAQLFSKISGTIFRAATGSKELLDGEKTPGLLKNLESIDKTYGFIGKKTQLAIIGLEQGSKAIASATSNAAELDKNFKKTSDSVKETVVLTREQQLAIDEAKIKAAELQKILDKQSDIYKTIVGENKKLTTEVSNQGAEQNEIISNNLKLAIETLNAKEAELKAQGLLNDSIKEQISAQKSLLSAKAREEINGQLATADTPTDVRESRKDNQFISDDTIKTIGDAFGNGAGAIAASISSAVTPFTSLIGAAEAVVGVAQKLIDFLPNILNSIANVFTSLTALPQTLLAALQNVFNSLGSLISDFLGNLLSGLGDIVLSAFTFLYEGIPNALIKLAEALPNIIGEAVPKLVDGFVKLFDNVGPLVEKVVVALSDAMPLVVESLVDSLITRGGIVRIAYAFGKALTVDVPLALAKGFLNSIVSLAGNVFPGIGRLFASGIKIPVPDWITKLKIQTPEWLSKFTASLNGGRLVQIFEGIQSKFQSLIDAIKSITGQGGGGTLRKIAKGDIKGVANDVGSGLKSLSPFALGGEVPSGFPGDTFPARLSSGENVIDRSLNDRLSAYLDGEGSTRPIQIILKVGEQEMANIIYGLNKKGFRLA